METIFAAVVGGLFVLLGNYAMACYQRKTLEIQFQNNKEKSRIEWKRQEARRLEERSFELKRKAYNNWITMIQQAGTRPVHEMEFIAALANLGLCGSNVVRQEVPIFIRELQRISKKYLNIIEKTLHIQTASQKLSTTILDDFHLHMQADTEGKSTDFSCQKRG